jgi:hypothetical protein
MTQSYTEEQFTAAMEQAVEMRGEDFTYPVEWRRQYWETEGTVVGACKYQHDGEPACLIGLALYLLDPELLPDEGSWTGARVQLESAGIGTVTTWKAASDAQVLQDANRTWGEALAGYKSTLEWLHL